MHNNDRTPFENMEEALAKDPGIFDRIFFSMMADDDLPEEVKVKIRITNALKKFRDKMDILLDLADPEDDEDKLRELYPMRQEILEYIRLVSAGLDTFLTGHDLPIYE